MPSIRQPQVRPTYVTPNASPGTEARRLRKRSPAQSRSSTQTSTQTSNTAVDRSRISSSRASSATLVQDSIVRTTPADVLLNVPSQQPELVSRNPSRYTRFFRVAVPVLLGAAVVAFACASMFGGVVLIAAAMVCAFVWFRLHVKDARSIAS